MTAVWQSFCLPLLLLHSTGARSGVERVHPVMYQAEGDHYEETNSIGPVAVPRMLENLDVLFDFEKARAR